MDHRPPWSPAQQRRLAHFGVPRCVDVHCHCLPGLDDGPETLADSIALCAALVDDGVTSVVATPHQLGGYDRANSAPTVQGAIEQLTAELAARQIPLEIVAGGDVRVDERLLKFLAAGEITTIGGAGRHLLLELPHEFFIDPSSLIKQLHAQGIQAVMTHPERHRYLDGQLERIQDWVGLGAAIQVTAGSLTGDFGSSSQRMSWELLEANLVSVIASDAHDAEYRPPLMTAALAALDARGGAELARRLCIENPLHIWNGELIPSPGPASTDGV